MVDIPSLSLCVFFCDAVSVSDYIASNVIISGELGEFGRKLLWSNQYTSLALAWGD